MFKIFGDDVRSGQRQSCRLAWSQRRVDGVDVIYLAGELDLATAAELTRRLMSAAESSTAATIALDLSDVHFIDAHSISVIVAAREAATDRGRQFYVQGLHGTPAMIFNTLGLEPILVRQIGASDVGRGARGRDRRAGGVARRVIARGTRAAG